MRTNYIEYRIYLNDDVDRTTVLVLADQLQDMIADWVSESEECAPKVFTQDVTYEVTLPETKQMNTQQYKVSRRMTATERQERGITNPDTWLYITHFEALEEAEHFVNLQVKGLHKYAIRHYPPALPRMENFREKK